MAKAAKQKKTTDATEAFEALKAFIEKALGHGLVTTEQEKDAIEAHVETVDIALSAE